MREKEDNAFVNNSRHASYARDNNYAVSGIFTTAILLQRQTACAGQPARSIAGLLLSGRRFHPERVCENHDVLCGLLA